MARKQGGHDDGGGGGGGANGGLLFGLGAIAVGLGGIAAISGIGAPAAPFLLGGGAVLMVVGGIIYLGGPGCFVEGTMVATAEGPVPIERIRAGDQVYTVDLDEGKITSNRVLKTFKFGRNEIVELGVGDE